MPKRKQRIAAAIDIGSNSAHLLVARARGEIRLGRRAQVASLVDRSELLGLGDVVDRGRHIAPEPLAELIESLHRFQLAATDAGAERLVIVGTEPLRRAVNSDEVGAAVERYLGIQLAILTEHQEAALTFVGVTQGRLPSASLAVVDIGGGSTEVALHMPGRALDVIPLRLGSARLTNAIVRGDPPTPDEIASLERIARQVVANTEWPDYVAQHVRDAVFVGGTATNIARLGRLERGQLEQDLQTIGRLKAADVVARFAVRPRRAQQLAAGVAIVNALLERLGVEHAGVSEASLRDGAIIAALHFGDEWLARLDELVA